MGNKGSKNKLKEKATDESKSKQDQPPNVKKEEVKDDTPTKKAENNDEQIQPKETKKDDIKERKQENEIADANDEKKEESVAITSIEMEDKTAYYFLNPNGLNPEQDRDVVSILALSDTLSTHTMDMMTDIPNVDILIHAGNFTMDGTLQQIKDFNEWINLLLKTKKCKYALIIAGNHEVTFHRQYYQILQNLKNNHKDIPTAEGMPDNNNNNNNNEEEDGIDDEEGMDKVAPDITTGKIDNDNDNETDMVLKCRHSIKNAIYLEDQGIEILGLKFYGTPWTMLHDDDESGNNPQNYRAFCVATENEMKVCLDKIPYDVDVMISHYPPYLHSDGADNVGSKALIEKLYMDVQPNVCVFGHITSCHGVTKQANMETTFLNVNCSNEESEMEKKPILFYLQPKLESFF